MGVEFQNTKFLKVASGPEDFPESKLPEIVIAGRSNVGKSSFINSFFNNKNLARVSSSPGKTQLAVFFVVDNAMIFVDLPGYGYAKTAKVKIKQYEHLVNQYLQSDRGISLAILLLDVRHEPSERDRMMKEWLESQKIDYIVVATKSDKLKPSERNGRLQVIRHALELSPSIPLILFSALTREGTQDVKKTILQSIYS